MTGYGLLVLLSVLVGFLASWISGNSGLVFAVTMIFLLFTGFCVVIYETRKDWKRSHD